MATHYLDKFSSSSEQLTEDYTKLLGKVVQAGGKKFVYAYASTTLTKLTPYTLYFSGGATVGLDPAVRAMTDSTTYNLVVVPSRTLTVGQTDWFQFQGPIEDVILASHDYTATEALLVYDGGIIGSDAAPTNADSNLGHIMARASTGAIAVADIFLHGRWALGTT